MNYKLPDPEQKSQYVQSKFTEIAPKYDRFNDFITLGMHRYWKRFVVRQTGVPIDGICLDLCCGTGDIAERMKEALPHGKVYGLDFSKGMLSIAQERERLHHKGVFYVQGDAMRIPFPEDSFDAITVGYGLRNVRNLNECIQDILRVLKPGGVLVSLDVGKIRLPVFSEISQFLFFKVIPMIGKRLLPDQDMFDYLPHSSISYPDQETLKRLLLHSGFKQVDYYDFFLGASTIHVAYKP